MMWFLEACHLQSNADVYITLILVQAACKMHGPERMRSFNSELAVLRALKPQPHPSLPHLLDYDVSRRLLVTQPVVHPMRECGIPEITGTGMCPPD